MLRSRKGDAISPSDELLENDSDYEMVSAPLLKPSRLGSLLADRRSGCWLSLTRILRWSHHQWSTMSSSWRTVAATILMFTAMFLLSELVDFCYQYTGLDHVTTKSATASDSFFSVVINTYKRPKALKEAVQHYAVKCGPTAGVQKVFVIWSELDQPPPEPATLLMPLKGEQHIRRNDNKSEKPPSDVIILQMNRNSLNTRFLPILQLTTDAVFMVDDDVRVSCQSLRQGFEAWWTVPDAMVGYYPRLATIISSTAVLDDAQSSSSKRAEFVYHSWPMVFLRQRFNFVLTKASFFHRKYLELYSSDQHPQEILDYVDRFKNCEDVAMSLLVANATNVKPVYIEGSVADKGLFGGISTGSGHMARRSQCLTDLTQVYQKHGWKTPLDDAVSLRKNSWIHHAFVWQYKPANVFEWFALGNFFK